VIEQKLTSKLLVSNFNHFCHSLWILFPENQTINKKSTTGILSGPFPAEIFGGKMIVTCCFSYQPVMCLSHFCRVTVTSPSSQSYLKFFRVESESWLGRVRVKSQKLSSHLESLVCKFESMSSHMKFHIFFYIFML